MSERILKRPYFEQEPEDLSDALKEAYSSRTAHDAAEKVNMIYPEKGKIILKFKHTSARPASSHNNIRPKQRISKKK